MEDGSDALETENPDGNIIACMNEICDKMFIKWKQCKKHMMKFCGIKMEKGKNNEKLVKNSMSKAKSHGAQWKRGGIKKDLLPKMSSGPTEQAIVQVVEQFYASLNNQINRKHVLGHLRKIYGKGEFGRFGYGSFIEFSKRHGLEVYGFEEKKHGGLEVFGFERRKNIVYSEIKILIGKRKSPQGTVNFYCNSCGCDLNRNTGQDWFNHSRREAREHIQKFHPTIYQEIAQNTGLKQGIEVNELNSIIEESLKGHFENNAQLPDNYSSLKKNNEAAKTDILLKLCEVFYRSQKTNIFHCVLCNDKPIGRGKQLARDHLSTNHSKEEMEMKQCIKDKYDQYVNDNFETFLRLVLHKVETF